MVDSCRSAEISLRCLLLFVFATAASCGSKKIERYDVSGTVSYNGKPIPAGYLVFATTAGPGAQADIQDGKYQTRPGQGTIGGPHTVSIYGFDGRPYSMGPGPDGKPYVNPMGRPLFSSFVTQLELPQEAAVHNFEIPANRK